VPAGRRRYLKGQFRSLEYRFGSVRRGRAGTLGISGGRGLNCYTRHCNGLQRG